jgi:hypothetical protein
MATRSRSKKKTPKEKRDLKPHESYEILKKYLDRETTFPLEFKNHRRHTIAENTYRFTIDLMSLDFLISLIDDPAVKNVYFNPSIPPPGGSVDSISLRYKVYVQYFKI